MKEQNKIPKKEIVYIILLVVILIVAFGFHANLQMKRRTRKLELASQSIVETLFQFV